MPETSTLAEFTAALHLGPGPHPDGSPQSVHAGGANPATRPPRATEGQMGFDLEMRDVAKLSPDRAARRLRPVTTPKAKPAQEPEDGNSPKWQKWLADITSDSVGSETNQRLIRDVQQVLRSALPKATLKDLHDAYTITDPETGFRSEVDYLQCRAEDGEITIGGTVYLDPGKENDIGSFIRNIRADGTVHHTLFGLRDLQQGKGFGARFYRNSERVYQRMGVQEIRLEANDAVGGYAWARMGFDWDTRDSGGVGGRVTSKRRDAMLLQARRSWEGYQAVSGDKTPMPKITHAWELAALTTPDGTRIGKSIMLGSDWLAVKRLTPGAPGLRVGSTYYRAKDKQRQEDKRVGNLMRAEKERRRAD